MIVQIPFDLPPGIAARLLTGELTLWGGVVRDSAGRIVIHLKDVSVPKLNEDVVEAAAGMLTKPKKPVVIAGMNEDFFRNSYGDGAGNRPLLVLTGTHVETGCRLVLLSVRLTALNGPSRRCDSAAGRGPEQAALSNDALDYLCEDGGTTLGGLRRSTAALQSARFPCISPSGRMYSCVEDTATGVVDGGYSDNTGIDAILELWARPKPLVDEHNLCGHGARIEPTFVMIDNHYLPLATPRAPGRVQELYIPPATAGKPDSLDDLGADQRAKGLLHR